MRQRTSCTTAWESPVNVKTATQHSSHVDVECTRPRRAIKLETQQEYQGHVQASRWDKSRPTPMGGDQNRNDGQDGFINPYQFSDTNSLNESCLFCSAMAPWSAAGFSLRGPSQSLLAFVQPRDWDEPRTPSGFVCGRPDHRVNSSKLTGT
jgi:hypothetical protein